MWPITIRSIDFKTSGRHEKEVVDYLMLTFITASSRSFWPYFPETDWRRQPLATVSICAAVFLQNIYFQKLFTMMISLGLTAAIIAYQAVISLEAGNRQTLPTIFEIISWNLCNFTWSLYMYVNFRSCLILKISLLLLKLMKPLTNWIGCEFDSTVIYYKHSLAIWSHIPHL